ncbi:MAG: apolipoprotein N-acyltransferase [Blastococcus sp.]
MSRDRVVSPSPDRAPTRFSAGWRGARGLLRGPFRVLVGGQATGQLADGLAQIAFAQLVLFDIGRGATPARVAVVLAVTLLPFSVAGPIAGVLIDRWDRRRTLVVASWLRAGLALGGAATAVTRSEPAAFAEVLLLLSSSRFVLDAKGAVLPRTVPGEDLVRANAVSALLGMSAAFLGAIGGALFVGRSVPAGFLAAAVGYGTAAVVFVRLPFEGGGYREGRISSAFGGLLRGLRDGVVAVARSQALRRPLLAVCLHRLLLGAGFILLVLVADRRYHLSAPGYGLALAVTGVSAFAGSLLAPWLVRRVRAVAVLPLAFLPPAAGCAVAGYEPSLAALLGAVAVTAVSFQCLKVLADALVGRASPDAIRGRVFSLYDVLYNVAFVLAGLLMVPLWRPGAERALLWWLGAAYLLGWLVLARTVRAWPFGGLRGGTARPLRLWRGRGAALLAGALPVLAFPRPGLWWCAWFVLVPWLALARRAPSVREAALVGWCGAVGFLLAVHSWLLPSATVFLPVVVALLGLMWAPWAMLVRRLLATPLTGGRLAAAVAVVPAGWVLIEAVRSWSALGGPWGLLGASQWRSPVFLAPAALGGVWLLSYLVVAVNVALLAAVVTRRWTLRAAAVVLALGGILVGPAAYLVMPALPAEGTLPVAVVQAGVVPDAAARLRAEIAATERLDPGRFALVVWGESSVGVDLLDRPDLERRLQQLSVRVRADLLVNVDAAAPGGAIRKTSVLIGPDGVTGSYTKRRLVPFGEYIPLRPVLGWLATVTRAAALDRVRGSGTSVLHADGVALSPLICFESAFPDLSRTAVRDGADLLVFQTATTTFQGTWAPDQHAALAAVRAVETGRPTVQAALAGTTAGFDARGHLLAWHPAGAGTVVLQVPRAVSRTPYDALGDWVPAGSVALLAAALVGLSVPEARQEPTERRRRRRSGIPVGTNATSPLH